MVQLVLLVLQRPELLLALLEAVLLRCTQLLQLLDLVCVCVCVQEGEEGGLMRQMKLSPVYLMSGQDACGASFPSQLCGPMMLWLLLLLSCVPSAPHHHTPSVSLLISHLLLLFLLAAVAVLQCRLDLAVQLLEARHLRLNRRQVGATHCQRVGELMHLQLYVLACCVCVYACRKGEGGDVVA